MADTYNPYWGGFDVGSIPPPLSENTTPSGAASFLGWFTETVSDFARTYSGTTGSPTFGPLTREIPLPSWVPQTMPDGTPLRGRLRDQAAQFAYEGDPNTDDDDRVFMGRFDLVNDDATVQAGTDVSARTIRGLQGTDAPFAEKGAVKDKGRKVKTPDSITVAQAKELPWTWGRERQQKWLARMEETTGVNFTSLDEAIEVWEVAVDRASKMFTASKGRNLVTPWDAIDLYKDEGLFGKGGEAGEEPGFTGKRVTTSKDVNQISEGDAWTTMRSAVSSLLGRDPSDREVRDFAYRMNNIAAKNPSISKTTTTYRDGIARKSETKVVEPGMTANDVAMAAYEQAQDDPDYGAYQAASTYMNLLLQAIGPTV